MRKKNVATLEELVEAAKALEINLYAWEMAMHILGLQKSDFIHEVKDVLGVATFLEISEGGRTLFIWRNIGGGWQPGTCGRLPIEHLKLKIQHHVNR